MCIICEDSHDLYTKRNITVSDCTRVKGIPHLPNIVCLYVINCPNLNHIPALQNLELLSLKNTKVKELPMFPLLTNLSISTSPVTRIFSFPELSQLEIKNCPITSVYDLPELKFLFILNCPSLSRLHNCDSLQTIFIENAPLLEISNIMYSIVAVTIINCPLIDLSVFENVGTMHLENYQRDTIPSLRELQFLTIMNSSVKAIYSTRIYKLKCYDCRYLTHAEPSTYEYITNTPWYPYHNGNDRFAYLHKIRKLKVLQRAVRSMLFRNRMNRFMLLKNKVRIPRALSVLICKF
jgi:Leucine-rich repeat (LRR) protein